MQTDNSFIGDIKYSVLEPGIFLSLHPEWALLSGQEIDSKTGLGSLGVTHLPDARGVFLRGVHLSRQDGVGDPDGDNRKPLSHQPDEFRSHGHSINNGVVGWSNAGNGDAWRITSDDGPSWNNTNVIIAAQPVGGAETRPQNISVYIYVKIN